MRQPSDNSDGLNLQNIERILIACEAHLKQIDPNSYYQLSDGTPEGVREAKMLMIDLNSVIQKTIVAQNYITALESLIVDIHEDYQTLMDAPHELSLLTFEIDQAD